MTKIETMDRTLLIEKISDIRYRRGPILCGSFAFFVNHLSFAVLQ